MGEAELFTVLANTFKVWIGHIGFEIFPYSAWWILIYNIACPSFIKYKLA